MIEREACWCRPGGPDAPENAVRTVVFDIDTQRDFMRPDGRLYVPGAENIVSTVRRILDSAVAHDVPVVASLDAHAAGDPEFDRFPPHCVRGTAGQEKIPETFVGPFRILSNVPAGPIERRAGESLHVEKQTLSVLENVNFDGVLSALRPDRCLVLGVATEFCVRAAALGLKARCAEVAVVTDAVRAVDPDAGLRAFDEMRRAGIRIIESPEALDWIAGRERPSRPGAAKPP
jgi:nicotinamidase/pyrazinamidase